MVQIKVEATELYPWFSPELADPGSDARTYDVDEATLQRWYRVTHEAAEVQREIRDLVDPPCPECGHRRSRHQQWSAGWDYWGCLDHITNDHGERVKGCRCQHGKPKEASR